MIKRLTKENGKNTREIHVMKKLMKFNEINYGNRAFLK